MIDLGSVWDGSARHYTHIYRNKGKYKLVSLFRTCTTSYCPDRIRAHNARIVFSEWWQGLRFWLRKRHNMRTLPDSHIRKYISNACSPSSRHPFKEGAYETLFLPQRPGRSQSFRYSILDILCVLCVLCGEIATPQRFSRFFILA